MDTLIKFRQKDFGVPGFVKYVKTPQGIITTSALGVSSANLATNISRHNKDRSYQKQQLKAMNSLNGTLGKFNGTMERNMQLIEQQQAPSVPEKSGFTLFRLKNKK